MVRGIARERETTITVNTGVEGQLGTIGDIMIGLFRDSMPEGVEPPLAEMIFPGDAPRELQVTFQFAHTKSRKIPDIHVLQQEGFYKVRVSRRIRQSLNGSLTGDNIKTQMMQRYHQLTPI